MILAGHLICEHADIDETDEDERQDAVSHLQPEYTLSGLLEGIRALCAGAEAEALENKSGERAHETVYSLFDERVEGRDNALAAASGYHLVNVRDIGLDICGGEAGAGEAEVIEDYRNNDDPERSALADEQVYDKSRRHKRSQELSAQLLAFFHRQQIVDGEAGCLGRARNCLQGVEITEALSAVFDEILVGVCIEALCHGVHRAQDEIASERLVAENLLVLFKEHSRVERRQLHVERARLFRAFESHEQRQREPQAQHCAEEHELRS